MLKVKNWNVKDDPIIKYIKDSPITETHLAKVFGYSMSYFHLKLARGLNKQDRKTVKDVVDKLTARSQKSAHKIKK